MSRPWLPHPPAVIPPTVAPWCDVYAETPFRTAALAHTAQLHGITTVHLTPTRCDACRGWHNRTKEKR